jgi:hypothetical protein
METDCMMAYKLFIKKKKKRKEKLVIHALNSSHLLRNELGHEADDIIHLGNGFPSFVPALN